MRLVLLSGGSGKRLWPLSNELRSKQFLKVLHDKENAPQSMIQRVWSQLEKLGLADSSVIATNKSQVEMIHSQINPDVPVIIEPERRDTFPAIALTASYLFSEEKVSGDEVICVLPVDLYVEDDFFRHLSELEQVLKSSDADLALMGVTPTYPSEKYGYIIPDIKESTNNYIQVSYFKEKPVIAEAEELLQQQALWNCGIFAFKLDRIISLLEKKDLPVYFKKLVNNYHKLPSISFDYEIVEKANNVVALPYNGEWKDIGTWNTLTEEMDTIILGKGNMSHDSVNTNIINELNIPISVIGLSNVLVAASPDGILVTEKEASSRVKELVGEFEQRPMYEERRWGWYRVLDHTKYKDGTEVLTKRLKIDAGKNLSYQYHDYRQEVWTIVKGEGVLFLNNKFQVIRAGDVIEIPVGAKHAMKAVVDLEFIEVQTGTQLIEEDICRLFLTWEEIEVEGYALMK
ncbi:mannose-1-phosphate guanylyltransferase/mannose-6-phosphate isomerase [Bacillus cereus VD196]|uniref:Mannose-1-phosphate guanylyltransferase/mannose-6-phosphate isomerase n=1 Tax=Bacillus cereus VD196 TaxID=1053243 RepID=A0A9W5V5Z6_BACCE|nr:sugar phosphate nucleotidyltransferase [Bacillus cereus]EOO61931.1 mannose-1-phosphate guanylyltransferase/mannose-6-phosphate isomerase [Bacillus cereus VD196]